jgi:hypothetical protein
MWPPIFTISGGVSASSIGREEKLSRSAGHKRCRGCCSKAALAGRRKKHRPAGDSVICLCTVQQAIGYDLVLEEDFDMYGEEGKKGTTGHVEDAEK